MSTFAMSSVNGLFSFQLSMEFHVLCDHLVFFYLSLSLSLSCAVFLSFYFYLSLSLTLFIPPSLYIFLSLSLSLSIQNQVSLSAMPSAAAAMLTIMAKFSTALEQSLPLWPEEHRPYGFGYGLKVLGLWLWPEVYDYGYDLRPYLRL